MSSHGGVGNQSESKDIFISLVLFLAKVMWYWRVFIDEMISPTILTLSGLIVMTMELNFMRKRDVGAVIVILASFFFIWCWWFGLLI